PLQEALCRRLPASPAQAAVDSAEDFLTRAVPDAPPDLESAAASLRDAGFAVGWQVAHAPMEVAKTILSPTDFPRELTLVALAQQRHRAADRVSSVGAMTRALAQVRRGVRRYSCPGMRGAPNVDHGHMKDHEAMKPVVRAARRAAPSGPDKSRHFLRRGPLEKWAPQWLGAAPSAGGMTHAQW
ncbi:unnamed protein product, partial [Prorocentrum cordatum]